MGLCTSKAKKNGIVESKKEARLRQKRENEYREELLFRELQAFRRLQELEQQQKKVEQKANNISDLSGDLNAKLSNLSIREAPFVEEIKRDPQLESDSYEFIQQKNLFRKTNKKFFKPIDIQKIFNPYLYLQFKLKKKQYQERHNSFVHIKKMYHGTKSVNINDICKTNFDWRRSGDSTGHRFGQGISFSPYSNYATHYGDKKSYRKVMFAVDILVSKSCVGEGNTVIPEGNADTTVNNKGSVYVKYEDNAFYPTYLITYEGFERRY